MTRRPPAIDRPAWLPTFAIDHDLAVRHVLPDLIEAIRAALDANVPRVTAAHPKDVADRDPLPPGLQFEPGNLAGRPPR